MRLPPDPEHALAPRALYQDVAEKLRQQIFNRELEPGSWIDERSSRPVRHQPHAAARGAEGAGGRRHGDDEGAPRRLCHRDVDRRCAQVYHLLALLESDAAGEGRALGPPAPIWLALRALHERLERRSASAVLLRRQRAFHMRLLALSGNRWRQQIVTDLRKVMAQPASLAVQDGPPRGIAAGASRADGSARAPRCRGGQPADAPALREQPGLRHPEVSGTAGAASACATRLSPPCREDRLPTASTHGFHPKIRGDRPDEDPRYQGKEILRQFDVPVPRGCRRSRSRRRWKPPRSWAARSGS